MRSQELLRIDPRKAGSFKMDSAMLSSPNLFNELQMLGIGMDQATVREMQGFAMDDLQTTITTPSIGTPVQFLQTWLTGFVNVVTAARKIDDLVGLSTVGNWDDEEVVQGIMEYTGSAVPYGDYTNVPFSSWNTNYERRTNVRFEEGMMVGVLEEARAGRQKVNSAAAKREAAALALEIKRNEIGFYGYNNGNNRTYGFLNDPALPGYVNVPNGASGSPTWSSKTTEEIIADVLTALSQLRINSKDVIDPKKAPITLALPTATVDRLSTPTNVGYSVQSWLNDNYPNVRVESAPELDSANGGLNVFYLYAEKVDDMSSDDSRTWVQAVPSKFTTLGVEKKVKGYQEGYTNATAGLMLKRPYAIVRYSGI